MLGCIDERAAEKELLKEPARDRARAAILAIAASKSSSSDDADAGALSSRKCDLLPEALVT
jgi:hypothetical protein